MANSWELCISVKDRTIRLAVCRYNTKNRKIEVSRAIQMDLPQEFSSAKDAANSGVIVGLIRKAIKNHKITIKKYNLCISDRSIITRVLKLPQMDIKDLKNFMKLSIQQYFPIKPEDYCFDYKIQGVNAEDEKAYYNLLLVAIPKAIIDFYSGALLKCGLKPNLINIYSDVVANLFLRLGGNDIAILDPGYDYTEFIMLEGKSIFINSIINYEIPRCEEEGMNEESYLKNLTVEMLGEDFINTAETLKNYINFFSSRHHGKTIENIYFIGEGAMLKEAIYYIEDNLDVKIKTGQEFLTGKVSTLAMPTAMKKEFYIERYCACLGLIVGGMKK